MLDPAMLFLELVPLPLWLLGMHTLIFPFSFLLRKSLQVPSCAFFSLILNFLSPRAEPRGSFTWLHCSVPTVHGVSILASPRFASMFWLVCCYSMKSRREVVGFYSSLFPQSLSPSWQIYSTNICWMSEPIFWGMCVCSWSSSMLRWEGMGAWLQCFPSTLSWGGWRKRLLVVAIPANFFPALKERSKAQPWVVCSSFCSHFPFAVWG